MTLESSARIIALCGDEGIGKSYLAAHSGRKVVSFADPLRDIVSEMTGIPPIDLKEQSVKTMSLSSLHLFGTNVSGTIRDLLIDVGKFMRKYNDEYFVLAAVDRLSEPGLFIIDDLRFDHEAEMLRKYFDKDEVEIVHVASEDAEKMWHYDKYSIVGFPVDRVYINSRGL